MASNSRSKKRARVGADGAVPMEVDDPLAMQIRRLQDDIKVSDLPKDLYDAKLALLTTLSEMHELKAKIQGLEALPNPTEFQMAQFTANNTRLGQLQEQENLHRAKIDRLEQQARGGVIDTTISADTSAFWKSVIEHKWDLTSGGSLRIPSDLYEGGKTVFVRRSYIDLVNIIEHQMQRRDLEQSGSGSSSRPRTLSVYGTPGVGKSIFASLLVGAVGRMSPGATIFYHAGQTRCADLGFLVFRPSPRRNVEYVGAPAASAGMHQLDHAEGDILVWLIVDGVKPPVGLVVPFKNLRIIVVSSANLETKKWLHEWDKHTNCRLLMEPFAYDECAAVNALLGAAALDEATMDFRFRMFGGAARMIFDVTRPANDWLNHFVGKHGSRETLGTLLADTSEGSMTEHEDKSSRIVHLRRDPEYALLRWLVHVGATKFATMDDRDRLYVTYHYDFRVADLASPTVKDALASQFWRVCQREVRHRLATAEAIGSTESHVVSWLFEPKMHGDLRRGAPFRGHIGGENVFHRAMNLPESFFRTHIDLANTAAAGFYYRPTSPNCPSFDSFAKTATGQIILFQMTGQALHPINMPGLLKFFNVAVGTVDAVEYGKAGARKAVFVPDNTIFYFVVLPTRFAAGFVAEQHYVSGKGGPALQCTRNPQLYIKARVERRVICPVWDDGDMLDA